MQPTERQRANIRRNALTLGYIIRNVHLQNIDLYARVLTDRLLPALTDEKIGKEADRVEDDAFDRLSASVDPQDYRPGDFVDPARDEAVEYMLALRDARQGIINTFVAGLYHRFEQQFSTFLRTAVGERKRVFRNVFNVADAFTSLGVGIRQLPGWDAIEELHLIANCSKHGEGQACRELREKRPDLFVKKLWEGDEVDEETRRAYVTRFVEEPLGGEGVYVSEGEFGAKVEAIKRFWLAFAETLEDMAD